MIVRLVALLLTLAGAAHAAPGETMPADQRPTVAQSATWSDDGVFGQPHTDLAGP